MKTNGLVEIILQWQENIDRPKRNIGESRSQYITRLGTMQSKVKRLYHEHPKGRYTSKNVQELIQVSPKPLLHEVEWLLKRLAKKGYLVETHQRDCNRDEFITWERSKRTTHQA